MKSFVGLILVLALAFSKPVEASDRNGQKISKLKSCAILLVVVGGLGISLGSTYLLVTRPNMAKGSALELARQLYQTNPQSSVGDHIQEAIRAADASIKATPGMTGGGVITISVEVERQKFALELNHLEYLLQKGRMTNEELLAYRAFLDYLAVLEDTSWFANHGINGLYDQRWIDNQRQLLASQLAYFNPPTK